MCNIGALASITWYPIPTIGRRWMAIPHAGTTSAHRIEALTKFHALMFSFPTSLIFLISWCVWFTFLYFLCFFLPLSSRFDLPQNLTSFYCHFAVHIISNPYHQGLPLILFIYSFVFPFYSTVSVTGLRSRSLIFYKSFSWLAGFAVF